MLHHRVSTSARCIYSSLHLICLLNFLSSYACLSHSSIRHVHMQSATWAEGGQLYLSTFSCIRASCSVLQCIGMFSVYSPVYFSVISAFSIRLEPAFSLLAALAARDMHSHSSQQSHLSSGLGLGPVPLAAAASGPYPIPCSIPEEFLVAPVADECESVSHFLFSYFFGKYKILWRELSPS